MEESAPGRVKRSHKSKGSQTPVPRHGLLRALGQTWWAPRHCSRTTSAKVRHTFCEVCTHKSVRKSAAEALRVARVHRATAALLHIEQPLLVQKFSSGALSEKNVVANLSRWWRGVRVGRALTRSARVPVVAAQS